MTGKTKVLIGDDSAEYGLSWASLLKEEGMFAVTRQKNGRVILDSVKSDMPDYLIIDAKMPELDAVSLLEEIKAQKSKLPVTIVVSNLNSPEIEKEVMDAGASYFMVKPFAPYQILKKISNLISFKNATENSRGDMDNVEYIVTDIIHQIGIPAHIKGYHYLRTAIILSIGNDDMINNVTKLLYPSVAQKYNTTPSRVERAIRHAIEIAWDRGDVDMLNKLFGYTVHTTRGKPTNSEFIALIADNLRLKFYPNIAI
ncbi:MAG: sporulation transcription factor Spo0A [Ruminiclostridium sp.]